MDFHSLARKDLQFLCKRNKIPANMTNLAMADTLKSLEIVEGLNEYMSQSDSNAPHSPISVAKQPPNTATRTTRRKTAMKAEPQSSSQLANTSKSLAGEMDQELKTNNVKFEASVAKTPAARSTRKASCSSKVQESKKVEMVQSVYSTRRSTRLLEKCMADLSLKAKPEKNEETEQQVSASEMNSAGLEEDEVIPGRDLSASIEKEWEVLKNDSDKVAEDIGDIAISDANIETNKEKMNAAIGDENESENSLLEAEKEEDTLQDMCEEGSKKNDNDQETGDLDFGDIPVLEYANTEMNNDIEESKNDQAFDSLVQVDQQGIEDVIEENGCDEADKINNFDTMVDQTDDGDSETEPEEDDSSFDIISEADSNQAVLGSDIADEEMILSESEGSAAAPTSILEEATKVRATTPLSPFAAGTVSVQFPRPNKSTTPSKKLDLKMVNVDNKENNMEMMMMTTMDVVVNNNNDNGENKGEAKKKKKKVEIDEEKLKDVSRRQLVKMLKELSLKSSNNNRTALQTLPANNI